MADFRLVASLSGNLFQQSQSATISGAGAKRVARINYPFKAEVADSPVAESSYALSV